MSSSIPIPLHVYQIFLSPMSYSIPFFSYFITSLAFTCCCLNHFYSIKWCTECRLYANQASFIRICLFVLFSCKVNILCFLTCLYDFVASYYFRISQDFYFSELAYMICLFTPLSYKTLIPSISNLLTCNYATLPFSCKS